MRILLLAVLALVLATFTARSASASILTFSQPGIAALQDYGDNVASTSQSNGNYGVGSEGFTPNIVVSYADDNDNGQGLETTPVIRSFPQATIKWGDLLHVVADSDSDNHGFIRIVFTPAPGFDVLLYSLDFAARNDWFEDPQISLAISDFDGISSSVVLHTSSPVVSRSTHTTLDFSSNPLRAGDELFLEFRVFQPAPSDTVGIDNIRFGQIAETDATPGGPAPVPEPSSVILFAFAGAFLAGARLKHRQRGHSSITS